MSGPRPVPPPGHRVGAGQRKGGTECSRFQREMALVGAWVIGILELWVKKWKWAWRGNRAQVQECCRKGTVKLLQLPRGRAWARWSSQAEGSGRSGCWALPGAGLFMILGHTFRESSQRSYRVKYTYQSIFFYFYVPLVGSAKSVDITFKRCWKSTKGKWRKLAIESRVQTSSCPTWGWKDSLTDVHSSFETLCKQKGVC